MKRRDFVKAIGGALLLPSLRIDYSYDPSKYLARWCDPEPIRWDLSQPYVLERHAYATDLFAMARTMSRERDIDRDTERYIPRQTPQVWADHWGAPGVWRPAERPNFIEHPQSVATNGYANTCPWCDLDSKWCSRCEGDGFIYPETVLGAAQREAIGRECPDCRGHGVVLDPSCPMCHGRYSGYGIPSVQPIGGKIVSGRYWLQMLEIPGCEVNEGIDDPRAAIRFRSREVGIEGVVMPML